MQVRNSFIHSTSINRMRANIVLIYAWSALALLSCKDNPCDEFFKRIEIQNCHETHCQIDLKGLFFEPWDELFIFRGFNTPNDISFAIGFKYEGAAIYDHEKLILQIAGKQILKKNSYGLP